MKTLDQAIWAGDQDLCDYIAPCMCCCADHTSEVCPARKWHGCRGQHTMTHQQEEAWFLHYKKYYNFTREDF